MIREINQIKDRLVNKLLLLTLLNLGFALIFSLARWIEIGFHPSYIFQSIVYILLVFISLLRKHLSVNFKSHFLAIIYLVLGSVGLYLVAHYSAFFLVLISVSLATILLGRKTAFYYSILFLAIYIPIGWLHITNRITIQPDLNSYAHLITIWVSWFVSLLTLFIILIEGFGLFYNELVNSVNLRIAATDELRKSETFRRQVFDSSRLPIVVMDASTHKYIDCNPAAIEIYGYTLKEQVFGLTPPDVSAPMQYDETPSSEKAKFYIEKAIKEGSVVFEWKHQRPDGKVWDAEVHLLSFSVDDRALLQFSLLDITERKQYELKLKESEKNFRDLFNNNLFPTLISDFEGRILFYNQHTIDYFEIDTNRLNEIRTQDYYANPDQRKEFVEHLKRDGYVIKREVDVITSSGINKTALVSTKIINYKGIKALQSVFSDITERKRAEIELQQSEARLSALLLSMKDIIFEIDINGYFEGYYPKDIKGLYVQPDFLIGKKFDEVLPPDVSKQLKTAIENIYEGKDFEQYEYSLNINNNILYETAVVTPRHNNSNEIIGITVVCRNITDRKLAENITKTRLSLIQYAQDHSLEELLQKTLDELEVLTHSLIGFYHLVSDDSKSIELKAWSSRTSKEFCNIKDLMGYQYPVNQAGVWADSLREKRPVIHNDYKSLANRKGLPDGHAEVLRELVVPVIRGNKVVALLGVGNKQTEYTQKDVELASNFAQFTWEIVANKLVEDEIRRFKTIADHAVYGKAIATPEGKLVYVNKHFANIHGYKPEELEGLHLSKLHAPKQLEKVEETISQMIRDGHFESREIWHIHKDGREFPMLMNGIVLRDANSNPEYLATSAVDISERKKIEDQLRKLSQAVEQSPVSVVITNPDGNIEYVNPKFTEVTGYTLNEAKGQNPRVLKSGEQTPTYYKQLWQTISSGKEWQGEFHNKKKNGELYWESASISPIINSEGAITHYLAVKKDITEQKKLESELRVLSNAIEQNPASIVITNTNGEIEYVNPKFTQITGYTLDEAKGKNPRILKTGITTPEQYSNLWATISRGQIWQGEFCNKKKDGTKFWEFALISPVLDTFGKITHYVAVKEDITEKKEIERKIMSAVIEGEERERNRFSRDLHDGIGPLLSSIKLYFQWLSETDDPKKRKFIIENGDKNLNQALDSIREISNNLSPRTLNNLGVIAALKNFIENINRTRKLKIEFSSNTANRFDEKTEIIVYRIITELINNTLKYANAEKSEVKLYYNDEEGLLLLNYSDNGKGFDLAKVKAQPKGIGLTNIGQRVNSLNGKIDIKSSQGKGVKVSIELPLQKN